MRWGPGYQGSLMLSDNSPAFDMLRYSDTIDLNDSGESIAKINFTKFFSLLDTLDEQNIKEHLKWRNSNRHNSLLKILQKKTYVI